MGISLLRRVTFQSCRSIVGPVSLDFPGPGLTLVQGVNKDTGGSSGSGKSSIGLGIQYAFGSCPFPATEMQNWDTEAPLSVQVEFTSPKGEAVELVRGAKSHIVVNGQKTKGSVKAVNEKLQETVGLTPELLSALTYRKQKSPSVFLSMKDDDKKEFLSAVLGLKAFETAAEEAEAAKKELAVDLKAKQAVLDNAHVRLSKAQADLKPLVLKEFDETKVNNERQNLAIASAGLARAQEAVAKKNEEIAGVNAGVAVNFKPRQQELVAELLAFRALPQPTLETAALFKAETETTEAKTAFDLIFGAEIKEKAVLQATKTTLENERAQLARQYAERHTLQKAIEQKALAVKALSETSCPTCNQSWQGDDCKRTLEQEQAALAELQTKLESAIEAGKLEHAKDMEILAMEEPTEAIERTKRARAKWELSLEKEKAVRAQAHATHTAAIAAYAQKEVAIQQKAALLKNEMTNAANAATAALSAELALLQQTANVFAQEVDALKEKIAAADMELANVKWSNTYAETQHKQAQQAVAAIQAEVAMAGEVVESVRTRHNLEADLAAVLGRNGFLGSIFDEVLLEIAQVANKFLGSVPNTSDTTIFFVSETATTKAGERRTIVPTVTVRGHTGSFESALSGGMGTAVALAVDLALIEVVGNRTGVCPGWLFLDEAFEGLGLIEKEACLEILSIFAQERLVLVVDHDNQFKEMFSRTIQIRFADGVSDL
jgi:DNA repair exonuclease SbcCD ATPase subunit